MSYASDLLEQATALCAADPRRPKQANLRRAVSSAYYAVFHELTESAVAFVLPGRRWDLRVPLHLVAVGSVCVSLQEARHQADYDFSRPFTRFETETHIRRAADAIDKWAVARATPDGERFAMELLVGRLDA